MIYIRQKFNEYKKSHTGKVMPVWDSLVKYIPNED